MLTWLGQRWQQRRLTAMHRKQQGKQQDGNQPSAGSGEQPHRPCVLVVDDDLFIGRLMLEALGDDYDVEVAGDAHEAELVLERRRPDLVILDIMMPGRDGQEVGYQLHRHAHTRNIPFMLVSGDRRIAEKAATVGAAAYLAKPFELDELCRTVARILSSPPADQ